MPIVRGGYGFDFFGTGDYGVEGTTKLASSVVSGALASSGSIERVRLVDASASSASTNTTTIARVRLSGAAVSSTASTSSVAEQFVLKESDKFAYGTGAYGANVFDNANLQTIVSATGSFASVVAERVRPGDASIAGSASTDSSAIRVPEGAATVTASATTSADAQFSVAASASASAISVNTATVERKRLIGGALSSTSSFAAMGRVKWEAIGLDDQSWESIGAEDQTWDTISINEQTWATIAA